MVGTALAATVLVWLVGQLAAVLFGAHHWLPLSLVTSSLWRRCETGSTSEQHFRPVDQEGEPMAPARYDGHADWYAESVAPYSATATPLIMRLVGSGPGRCLDVGCGTGAHLADLAGAGWSVVGVDASTDQLRVARHRAGPLVTALVQGDAAALPFADGSFDLVVSAFTHTDVDDFAALAAEAYRVLRPEGRFVYVGLHPCFTGPFVEQPREDGARVVHPGYRQTGWRTGGPGTVAGSPTSLVGFRHLPLPEVLSSVLEAGLLLTHIEEGGNSELPDWLLLVARR